MMRVNVYAEEMTDRIEIISKEIDGHVFTGLRFYLELPVTVGRQDGEPLNKQGPFIHRTLSNGEIDDDSAAVTFWGKRGLREVLAQAMQALAVHYDGIDAATGTADDQGLYATSVQGDNNG